MPGQPVRVAIVSGSHLVRAGLAHLFADVPTRTLVSSFSNAEDVGVGHDLVIYDHATDGSEACADLRQLGDDGPLVALLVHSGSCRPHPARPHPTLEKVQTLSMSATLDELTDLVERVAASPAWPGRACHSLPHDLSDRELEVIELVASGLSNEQIAQRLYLSINSVKTYVRQAYHKIGVRDRLAAMRWALDHGVGVGRLHGSNHRRRAP